MKLQLSKDDIQIEQDSNIIACIPNAIPIDAKDDIEDGNCNFCYFYSPYFTAASNFWGIQADKTWWGMLCPLSLFSVENKELYDGLKGYQHSMMLRSFLHYINDSYEYYIGRDDKINANDQFTLNFPPNFYIFIYDSSVCNNLTQYLPSFYNRGFLYANNPFENINYSSSSLLQSLLKDSDKDHLNLKRVSECFEGFPYIEKLYKEKLPQNSHPAFRYIIIYQIIEYLMEIKKTEELFLQYQSSANQLKNDFRENIQKILKDDYLINLIYTGISLSAILYSQFCSEAQKLYNEVNKEQPHNLEDFKAYMYGVRNIIVHNFKESSRHRDIIRNLVEMFEVAIYELMINVKVDKCDKKHLFVVNSDLSEEENAQNLKEFYSSI